MRLCSAINARSERRRISSAGRALCTLASSIIFVAAGASAANDSPASGLLARENIIPWELRWDQAKVEIGLEQRARLLKSQGIQRHALMHSAETAAKLDIQIPAFRQQGVELAAVYFWLDSQKPGDDPQVQAAFEAFKRLGVRPQIWISQSTDFLPRTLEQWKQQFADAGFQLPAGYDVGKAMQSAFSSGNDLTGQQKEAFFKALHRVYSDESHLPRSPEEQGRRLERETLRVASLARLASRYGLGVGLYNHNGWFGLTDNQLAMIDRLKKEGITNVSIVYTFWHARDSLHDDVRNFRQVWAKIKPHVSAIGISGVRGELENVYPSDGDDEVIMMRVVQDSGWRGSVAVLCLNFGSEPASVLGDVLQGLDDLSLELKASPTGTSRPADATTQ